MRKTWVLRHLPVGCVNRRHRCRSRLGPPPPGSHSRHGREVLVPARGGEQTDGRCSSSPGRMAGGWPTRSPPSISATRTPSGGSFSYRPSRALKTNPLKTNPLSRSRSRSASAATRASVRGRARRALCALSFQSREHRVPVGRELNARVRPCWPTASGSGQWIRLEGFVFRARDGL